MDTQEIIKSPKIKLVEKDLEIEFEIELAEQLSSDNAEFTSSKNEEIEAELAEVNNALSENDQKIDELNIQIDRLTNNSDNIDNIVAVLSGIVAGIIDSLWVGEFSLDRGTDWSKEKVNKFVIKIAQSWGYQGGDLQGSISHLEQKFPLSSDSNTPDFGGGLQHHLRDFAHHPTIIGLIFSMLTQFTGKAYGTNTAGSFIIVEVKNKTYIGNNLRENFLFGFVYWFFHMVSDIAGSNSTPGAGTGLPGPLLSFAKKLSALPFFKNTQIGDNSLSVWISKLFNGTFFAKRDSGGKLIKESVKRFDFRAELGVVYELGRQSVPVILNECIVRGFYFIRRLTSEIRMKNISQYSELNNIEWKKTLPWKNRTIVRMLTISTTTFTLVDLADAAIRGALKSGGNPGMFGKEFILRVNFVGLGRFAIAVGTDVSMGIQRNNRRNERMTVFSEQLHLMNAKIYYLQANAWVAAEKTEETIQEVFVTMENTTIIFINTWEANMRSMQNISAYKKGIDKHNPDLNSQILDILKN